MTKSTDTAYPATIFYDEQPVSCSDGLTKRELFAAVALQGLMSSVRWEEDGNSMIFDYKAPSARVMAAIAVNQADELIKALNGQ